VRGTDGSLLRWRVSTWTALVLAGGFLIVCLGRLAVQVRAHQLRHRQNNHQIPLIASLDGCAGSHRQQPTTQAIKGPAPHRQHHHAKAERTEQRTMSAIKLGDERRSQSAPEPRREPSGRRYRGPDRVVARHRTQGQQPARRRSQAVADRATGAARAVSAPARRDFVPVERGLPLAGKTWG
jgi:hypothetical protein